MNGDRWILAGGAVVALAAGWLALGTARNPPQSPAKIPNPAAAQAAEIKPKQASTSPISTARDRLRTHTISPQAALAELRAALSHAPDDEAAAAIADFLKSGADAPTGLPFLVGPDGKLAASPTLRVGLLDILPAMDPSAALAAARDIMDRRTTPDEYALALRNLAWNDLDGDLRGELDRRFRDFLETPWIRQPTAGFLEAFDVAVELGDAATFRRLADVAAGSGPEVARAAWMSMDRMLVRDPALLETTFGSDPHLMAAAPLQRASLLSRLNISRPGQREILVRYLAAPDHGDGELDYFSRIFPNRNQLSGNRLVTAGETAPSLTEIAAADSATRDVLATIPQPASPQAAAALRAIRDRLRAAAPPPQ